jgi:hypothetical protein
MASREKQKRDTNKALWEAFERLKNGEPEVIKGKYNINPTSVQKEARRPYGTISGHPDVEKAVKQYKAKEQAEKEGLASETELLRKKVQDFKRKLNEERRKKNDYRDEKEAAEATLKEETERTISLVASLLTLIPVEDKIRATNIVNTRKTNVLEFKIKEDE